MPPAPSPDPQVATLEMVAAEAGVSRSTVSRVVNGSPKVSAEVVDTVRAAITRLNYVPNRAARSLASRSTYAIALVVAEDTGRFFGDPYFASVVKGITARLDTSDYILSLLVASSDPSHKTMRFLQGGNVDGALVVSHHSDDADLSRLSQTTLPMVFGGRPPTAYGADLYYVDVDNRSGGEAATRHLVDQGCRRIGTIAGPADMTAAQDRLEGWRRALTAADLPTDAVGFGEFSAEGAEASMRELLDQHPDLDGLFVASDLMARGALTALRERGIEVPRDLKLIGYDDSPAATSGQLALTTVRQPSEETGRLMADTLLALLDGQDPQRQTVLPTELIRRDTA